MAGLGMVGAKWDEGGPVWPEAVLLASTDSQLVKLAYRMVEEGVEGPLRDLWWGQLEGRAERRETKEWLREMKGWKGGVGMEPQDG